MTRSHLLTAVALNLLAAHIAAAQATPQISVLQPPSAGIVLPAQLAQGIISVHYDGRLDPSRGIWVRVFRDSLDDLTRKYPNDTAAGKCVVYAHAARFRVNHAFDRELRIGDLVGFFQVANRDRQTLTLVFEEGDDADSNGPLRLDKSAVPADFKNAIEMPLIAPDSMKQQWDIAAQRAAEAQRPPEVSFLSKIFGTKEVSANERPKQAAPTPTPIPDKVFLPPCQRVRLIPYTALATNAQPPADTLEALAPAGQREPEACGQ